MGLLHLLAPVVAKYRCQKLERRAADAPRRQRQLLLRNIRFAKNTVFGKAHDFASIKTYADYAARVPVRNYEQLRPNIEEAVAGKPDVLWPGRPKYFAKTSGTTSGAKYIPITKDSMPYHVSGARDTLLFYIYKTGKTGFIGGKMSFLSGSPVLETNVAGLKVGRLSGIAHHYVPGYLQRNRVPSHETNCIDDWEEKMRRAAAEMVSEDLRLISGIPPWVQMLFEEVEAQTGKSPAEVWPNLQLFVQGGVDFTPYREMFMNALGRATDVLEVYPASEGFIALQNDPNEDGLLLMTDYGMFYEFIPMETYGTDQQQRLSLAEVELDTQYAIILTTNAGLWAYDIGDTVKFVSLDPPKIKVTGRTKHFISAFGEHVIQEEVNEAMNAALRATGGAVTEFTVAPLVADEGSRHEWYVEFEQAPEAPASFARALDEALQEKNNYYADLRKGGMLAPAALFVLRKGAARDYMKSVGKLGGQNKFPRLSNKRDLAEGLAGFVERQAG